MGKDKLTGKQTAFVEHYLQTLNATEAARRAKYTGSDGALRVTGHRQLTRANVRQMIAERLKENRITTDEIVARLRSIASLDIANLKEALAFTEPVDILRKAEELGLSHLIKNIKRTKDGIEVQFHDPLRALDILARHLLPTKVDVEVDERREIVVKLIPVEKDPNRPGGLRVVRDHAPQLTAGDGDNGQDG